MFLADLFSKRVLIPVRYARGKFVSRISGEELTELADGAECEIVTGEEQVADRDLLAVLSFEETTELLPAGVSLYALVSSGEIPEEAGKNVIRPKGMDLSENEMLVRVELKAPLRLRFRGTKTPALLDCPCRIPGLRESAASLNHAYRIISTAFEPDRRSYGGSVFLKLFLQDAEGKWLRLGELRDREAHKHFAELKKRYGRLKEKSRQDSLFDGGGLKQPPIRRINLRADKTRDQKSRLDAKIDEQDNLVLEGYDIGKTTEAFWGDSDYEYWVTVDREYKDSVLLLLIKDRFASETKFREWLEENGIPGKFDSWV